MSPAWLKEKWEAYKRQQQAIEREQRARAQAKVAADRDRIRAARLERFLPAQEAASSKNRDTVSKAPNKTKITALGYTFKGPQPGTTQFIEQQRQRGRELEVRRRSEGFEATERVRITPTRSPTIHTIKCCSFLRMNVCATRFTSTEPFSKITSLRQHLLPHGHRVPTDDNFSLWHQPASFV